MKKIALLMALLMVAMCFTACGQKTGDTDEDTLDTPQVGSWNIDTEGTCTLPEDAKLAFDSAMEGYTGMGFEPLALVGRQLVSGNNYMILARATTVTAEPETSLKMVFIYQELGGSAQVIHVKDFDLDEIEAKGSSETPTGITGGWQIATDNDTTVSADIADAFEKAQDPRATGVGYSLTAGLATKIVSGTEYAALVLVFDPIESSATPQVGVMFITVDAEQNVSEKTVVLDITEFTE